MRLTLDLFLESVTFCGATGKRSGILLTQLSPYYEIPRSLELKMHSFSLLPRPPRVLVAVS